VQSDPSINRENFLALVIDEDRELCELVPQVLRESGCRVQCLPLSDKMAQVVRDLAPDLIIIDVSLPDRRGLDLVRRLENQRQTRKIPIIVTSGQAELEYELLEVFDFLVKPLNSRRLLEDVRLLTSRALGHELSPFAVLDGTELATFQDFLHHQSGLHFDVRNLKILERGLTHRMRALGIVDHRTYYTYLTTYQESRQELKKLLGLLTIGETYFFRYYAHYEALIERVIPELIERNRKSKRLRFWSAGCSTGEEPYSLAMLLLEHFPEIAGWDIVILATDINKRALSRAREGHYSGRALRLTPPNYIARYFRQTAGGFMLDSRVRGMVHFAYLNLQTGLFPAIENGTNDHDLIFCRNVMIYFRLATTRTLVERFSRCLRPHGYFFMGHAETMSNISEQFVRLQHKGGFYYRRKEVAATGGASIRERPELPFVTKAEAPVAEQGAVAPPSAAAGRDVPADPDVLLREGELAFAQENYKTASQKYAMLLEINPQHAAALLGQGFIHANQEDYPAALACCERALHADDLCAGAYFLRGLIFDHQGDLDAALVEYRKALLLEPGLIMAHYNLSKIFWRQARIDDARRELNNTKRLLERTPGETQIPYSGGLSRAVFLEVCREDMSRSAGLHRHL